MSIVWWEVRPKRQSSTFSPTSRFNLCFRTSTCIHRRRMHQQNRGTCVQHHTQTVFRATAQESGLPVPVLAIQPLNLAFMNGNIFSFSPKMYSKANLIRVIHMLIHKLTGRFLHDCFLYTKQSKYKQQGAHTGKDCIFGFTINNSKLPIRVTKCGWKLACLTAFTLVCTHVRVRSLS